ncbi:hypothetical protein [Bradyrhizobium sp. BR 1432]|uniref:hypothetical protein n=1 Tax=Bradyrhizobium sp. BR 1432 TaxID=3447966 RepID=UPI003EE7CCB6
MHAHWTPRLATGASIVLATSLLSGSPASAYYAGFFCSEQSAKRANYTWADGSATTTVYYNNHCGRRVNVTLNFITVIGKVVSKCWRTPAGKSHKVWGYSDLNDIAGGC